MARPLKPPDERPVLVFNTEVRIYVFEPELLAYFTQYQPRQYATAIKRPIRAALSGGGHPIMPAHHSANQSLTARTRRISTPPRYM